MSEAVSWQLDPSYTLTEINLFNWGGFTGAHQALIDEKGTAIVGPTGSGKTTLVDALMTLLSANPKYNLASTGGHESDRDLVSYVRGVSGAGDDQGGQSHIARSGKTVTGISATLYNGEKIARLGALLWFDDTSSSASDMKKLWFFTTSPQHTLAHWLTLQQEGGMRALRALDKTETGIWTYPSKKGYLSRIRDFFEVRANAFNLLNRAAGLKQLNSIDEIFRELVLDDTSQFARANEVADSFDDLTAIHEELEIAKRQQRSLEPVKTSWEKYQKNDLELDEQKQLSQLLPIWFGERAYQLWQQQTNRLHKQLQQAVEQKQTTEAHYQKQKGICESLHLRYLQLGGSDIDTLEKLILSKQEHLGRIQANMAQYQRLVQQVDLSEELGYQAWDENQQAIEQRLPLLVAELETAKTTSFEQGTQQHNANAALFALENELAEIEKRPSSNIPSQYQHFRSALATELNVSEDDLPFVAELIQVKKDQTAWRGAIERAIGVDRLRILVPSSVIDAALHWVNQRNNRLSVHLLEVKEPDKQPYFWDDGFTHKVDYKPHAYREALKALLADKDRHCVASPEQLKHTAHAMTKEGLMSGKKRFFDKNDKTNINQGWLTGFDNRDSIASTKKQIFEAKKICQAAAAQLRVARDHEQGIAQKKIIFTQLSDLIFDDINTKPVNDEINGLQEKLALLTAPESDLNTLKNTLSQAELQLEEIDKERIECTQQCASIEVQKKQAIRHKSRAFKKAEVGLIDSQRELAQQHFPLLTLQHLDTLNDIEIDHAKQVQSNIEKLMQQQSRLLQELTKRMSDAKKEDRGALAEVGRELTDIPDYLTRLITLTEEALPEKRQRFQDYLNRSSDEGVTQLLTTIKNEVERIEEKLEDVNNTLRRVDFQPECYLQLISSKVVHESLRSFNKAKAQLASSRFKDDEGESHYKALKHIVSLLRNACEKNRTAPAKALLDPRFRLSFKVSVIDRNDGHIIETRSGSQGGSGGEKEIIASYVLTASLSYALCPDGSNRPLFSTIVLDEAFSRSSHAVAGRIIAALKEFGLHTLFITPNKEMRLLRKHTRSAIIVHRKGLQSSLTPLSWEELELINQQRTKRL